MRFPGIIPAVTTPFDESGAIDREGLAGNLAALLDAGVHGIVATGTMGEAGSLSTAERREVVAAVAQAVDGARAGDRGRLRGNAGRRDRARRRRGRRRRRTR